jgi:hypothetical protein
MQVTWIKSTTGMWLPMETFNLTNVGTAGVYVIWHGGSSPRYVKVGQGDIKDRLTKHRGDTEITAYNRFGALYVTWASLAAAHLDGVERYLGEQLRPLVAERFPQAPPIPVNLPHAA